MRVGPLDSVRMRAGKDTGGECGDRLNGFSTSTHIAVSIDSKPLGATAMRPAV